MKLIVIDDDGKVVASWEERELHLDCPTFGLELIAEIK